MTLGQVTEIQDTITNLMKDVCFDVDLNQSFRC